MAGVIGNVGHHHWQRTTAATGSTSFQRRSYLMHPGIGDVACLAVDEESAATSHGQ
jgi:hypothetical protein